MKLLVTGTRHGRSDVEYWLDRWVKRFGAPDLVVLGDSHLWVEERGVDLQAYEWAKFHGFERKVEFALARIPSPQRFFYERNQRMANHLRAGDWGLGFPDRDSRGTWQTLRFARERGATAYACPLYNPKAA